MNKLDQNQSGSTSQGSESVPPAISLDKWISAPQKSGFQTAPTEQFVDRRESRGTSSSVERRQFNNSLDGLSPEAQEFAQAVDHYKIANRRRFISYDEILNVVKSLGYKKN